MQVLRPGLLQPQAGSGLRHRGGQLLPLQLLRPQAGAPPNPPSIVLRFNVGFAILLSCC
jgi:hypothetical protein